MAKQNLTQADLERYSRHLALPEFGAEEQKCLKNAHILVVGAGGLGAAALPYLAGAGIGEITICDDDVVSVSNLHRQTIYKTSEYGQNKAERAAHYIQSLNPDIEVRHCEEARRLTQQSMDYFASLVMTTKVNLIFDGSDNFATKTLLNDLSIKHKIPLITASVNQTKGQCGIFAGYSADMPCYHCLFPELPEEARNCNEAGVLGTAAGLTGLYQAHLTILFLAGLYNTAPGQFLSFDFQTHRLQNLSVTKNTDCNICKNDGKIWEDYQGYKGGKAMADLMSYDDLKKTDYIIVDVRTDAEIANDPMPEEVLHIEVSQIPARYEELPNDKTLAFVCAGNVRSVQAANYLEALGYDNIVVLDKFSI